MYGHKKDREPVKTGDEYDYLSPWRKYECAGRKIIKKTKRHFNKRMRRIAKNTILKITKKLDEK